MQQNPPLILVTNDDGIHATGIRLLTEQLQQIGEVIVSAPHQEQSAVGHGFSLNHPVRILDQGPARYAVTGTPADSVLVGLFHLCPRKPDLVVSGINHGVNLGTDVFYSGTVAGALEAVIHGIPGLAVSQEVLGQTPEQVARWLQNTAKIAAEVSRRMLAQPPPAGVAICLNAPAAELKGYRWTRLGRRVYREQVLERRDLREKPYYWIGGPVVRCEAEQGTDSAALEAGEVSLTPLGLDLSAAVPAAYESWSELGALRRADEQ